MTTIQATPAPDTAADRFGRRVAARLDASAGELPYEIVERLRASRMQALALRKREVRRFAPQLAGAGGTGTLGDEGLSVWQRIGSVLPLLVLAAGLVLIHSVQSEQRASELAEVDTALLTDDLPPAAYADPGFAQFLKLANPGTP